MANRAKNRLEQAHADYVFIIVRRPAGWQPRAVDDVPPESKILQREYVASYEEAHDDLVRCNQYALGQELDEWAVILHPSCTI